MSLVNPLINDIVATTIENRSSEVADNITNQNAFMRAIKKSGGVKTISGGTEIRETFSTQENGNFGSYSGYDFLPTGAQDGLTAAQFKIAQYAVPVAVNGLEMLQNSGKQAIIELVTERVQIAENSMINGLTRHAYLDGTGNNGKNLTGLAAAVPLANASGTYGGIDRSIAANAVWRNQKFQATVDGTGVAVGATLLQYWNYFYTQLTRGTDVPTVIIASQNIYAMFQSALQPQQRFMSADSANAGYSELMFMGTPVQMETIASGIPTNTAYFLNTKYMKWRPHTERNMIALDDKQSVNQDATIKTLVWAGNITCSGAKFQGVFSNT